MIQPFFQKENLVTLVVEGLGGKILDGWGDRREGIQQGLVSYDVGSPLSSQL